MKKASVFLFAILLILCLSACRSEPETVEGYWMAENGETLSFTSNNKAVVDGISLDYSIYGENNLSIFFLGFAEEYKFDIQQDVLTLTDLSSNSVMTYYRDESKQAEIQDHLNKLAAERAEQERIQQQLEADAQAKEEREKRVAMLKNRISSIDKELPQIQEHISDNEGYIAENKQNIQEELTCISDLEKEISQLQQSAEITAQGDISYLEATQEYHYTCIEFYNTEIDFYANEISQYEQKITALEAEKAEILDELKLLGVH